VSSLTARLALAAAASAVALIVAAIALWFLGQALFLALAATMLSPAQAAVITGVSGLVLAALIGFLARAVLRPRRTAVAASALAPNSGSIVNDLALQLGSIVAQKAAATSKAHPYGTVGTAFAAGFGLGAMPELRKALLDLLKR
jgi:hypothetical protein